jgi:predicted site-specific integrase-resolvase
MRLLADPSVHKVVVKHPDGLVRFGYVEAVLAAQGRRFGGGGVG